MIHTAATTASHVISLGAASAPVGDGAAFLRVLSVIGEDASGTAAPPPAATTVIDDDDRHDAAAEGSDLPPAAVEPLFAWLPTGVLDPAPVLVAPKPEAASPLTVSVKSAQAMPASLAAAIPANQLVYGGDAANLSSSTDAATADDAGHPSLKALMAATSALTRPAPSIAGTAAVAPTGPSSAIRDTLSQTPAVSPAAPLPGATVNALAEAAQHVTAADARFAMTPRAISAPMRGEAVVSASALRTTPLAVPGSTPVPTAIGAATGLPDTAVDPRSTAGHGDPTARVSIAATPASTPTPIPGAIAPAFQLFGALRATAATPRDEPAMATDAAQPIVAAPLDLRHAIAASGDAAQSTLDMTDGRWPHTMIDRIERLRDAADATDTRIRLVPDALGAIDVSVKRDGDTLHVHFAAEQAATRALIQDAQPRLAAVAQERGLSLGQTSVDAGEAQQERSQQQRAAQPRIAAAPAAPEHDTMIEPVATGRLA